MKEAKHVYVLLPKPPCSWHWSHAFKMGNGVGHARSSLLDVGGTQLAKQCARHIAGGCSRNRLSIRMAPAAGERVTPASRMQCQLAHFCG